MPAHCHTSMLVLFSSLVMFSTGMTHCLPQAVPWGKKPASGSHCHLAQSLSALIFSEGLLLLSCSGW